MKQFNCHFEIGFAQVDLKAMETISENANQEMYSSPKTRSGLVKPTKKNRSRRASTGGILKLRSENGETEKDALASPSRSKRQRKEKKVDNRRKSVQFGNIHTRLYKMPEDEENKAHEVQNYDLDPIAMGPSEEFEDPSPLFSNDAFKGHVSLKEIADSYEDVDDETQTTFTHQNEYETESNNSTMEITGNLTANIVQLDHQQSLQQLMDLSDDSEDELVDTSNANFIDHDDNDITLPIADEMDETMEANEFFERMVQELNRADEENTAFLPEIDRCDPKTETHFHNILDQVEDPKPEDQDHKKLSAAQVLQIASVTGLSESFRRKTNSLILPLGDESLSVEETEEHRARQWFLEYPKYNMMMKGEEAVSEKVKETLGRIKDIERVLFHIQPEMFKVAASFEGKDESYQAPDGPFEYISEFQDYMRDLHELVRKSARTVQFQLKTTLFQNYYMPLLKENQSRLARDISRLKTFEKGILEKLKNKKEAQSVQRQYLREELWYLLQDTIETREHVDQLDQQCNGIRLNLENLILKKNDLRHASLNVSHSQTTVEESSYAFRDMKEELVILENMVGWNLVKVGKSSQVPVQLVFSLCNLEGVLLHLDLVPGLFAFHLEIDPSQKVLSALFDGKVHKFSSLNQLKKKFCYLQCDLFRMDGLQREIDEIESKHGVLSTWNDGLVLKVYFAKDVTFMVQFKIDSGYPHNPIEVKVESIEFDRVNDIARQTRGYHRLTKMCHRIANLS